VYLAKRPWDATSRDRLIARSHSGVDLIASDKALGGIEYYLFSRSDREQVLARFLETAAESYDFVLIDTPPSSNLLTLNALVASDRLLVPVQAEFFSLEGIVKIRQSIEEVRSRWNPRLAIMGVLLTQLSSRRKLSQDVIEALKGELGSLLFESAIHDNAAVAESSGHAQSVLEYDRSSRGAKDYAAAALEVLRRSSL